MALKLVRETDAGVVIRGRLGMHTSPAYAEDVYVGGLSGVDIGGHRAGFIVPVGASGVTVLCRKSAARDANPFIAPLSPAMTSSTARCGSTTSSCRGSTCFSSAPTPTRSPAGCAGTISMAGSRRPNSPSAWRWRLRDAMGLKEHEPTVEYVVDLVVAVQTVRSCILAAERDPEFTPSGYCFPNHRHLAPGGIALFRARQRISEILRIVPGSSLVVAPADSDLATPELAAGLEESFGGGGYTALQRAALLQLAADHVSSALDGRESAFELHASGGMPNWRGWLRQNFRDYNELANGVLRAIDLPMPEVDVSGIPAAPIARRRPVTVRAG